MQEDFLEHLAGLTQYLAERAREDAELRRHLLAAAKAFTGFLEAVEAEEQPTQRSAAETDQPAREPVAPEVLDQLRQGLAESPFRASEPTTTPEPAPAPAWQAQPIPNEELGLIEQRCTLKAEACRWALERIALMERGADREVEIAPRDQEMIRQAKELPDCFLWMNHPSGPSPSLSASQDWDLLSEAFENVARSAALVKELLAHADEAPSHFERALELAAEAQSALRIAVLDVGFGTDPDQEKMFMWLRRVCYEQQIYMERYMRVSQAANPQDFADLQRRIEELDNAFHELRNQAKQRKQLFSRARYHAKRIGREPNSDHTGDWRKIVDSCEKLIELGIAPSNVELRNILLPIFDDVPDLGEEQVGFQLILREVDAYAALNVPTQGAAPEARPAAEIRQVSALLSGRTVIMVGGDPRPEAKQAIEAALGLSELVWLTTNKHQSIDNFEPYVARPDVALVLLAIRWSSHVFGEIKGFCDRYGKPLVRLPAGYGVNQVAAQILSQASEQLKAGGAP